MRTILALLYRLFFLSCIAAVCLFLYYMVHRPGPLDYGILKDGDIVFQTSNHREAKAIMVATASPLTHVGIIKRTTDRLLVIEAGKTVKETPFSEWVEKGVGGFFSIYRYDGLTERDARRVLANAAALYGKGYDPYFSMKNDLVYCSELVYLAFTRAGFNIGSEQSFSTLNMNNWLAEGLIRERWQDFDECRNANFDYDQCHAYIMEQPVVTPASIASDPRLVSIYTNYVYF